MNLPAEIQTPLYALTAEFLEAQRVLSDLDLPDEVVRDTLEGLQGTLEVKAQNVAAYVLSIQSTVDAILVRAAEMRDRAARIQARADKLREYLKSNMELAGISKISSPEFEITIKNCPPHLVVDAESSIEAKWWREPKPQPLEIDKRAILDEIRQGREVEGCHASRNTRLEIK